MTESSDLAVANATDSALAEWGTGYNFDELVSGADTTASRDVFSSAEDKDKLVNVPFVVTGITFRASEKNTERDYVSLEATTKDNQQIVVNDGSTGIRRQVVAYMQFKQWITVPDLPEGSPLSHKFDQVIERWGVNKQVESKEDSEGRLMLTVAVPVQLFAKKGLRRSDYEGPTGDATTFYLA